MNFPRKTRRFNRPRPDVYWKAINGAKGAWDVFIVVTLKWARRAVFAWTMCSILGISIRVVSIGIRAYPLRWSWSVVEMCANWFHCAPLSTQDRYDGTEYDQNLPKNVEQMYSDIWLPDRLDSLKCESSLFSIRLNCFSWAREQKKIEESEGKLIRRWV